MSKEIRKYQEHSTHASHYSHMTSSKFNYKCKSYSEVFVFANPLFAHRLTASVGIRSVKKQPVLQGSGRRNMQSLEIQAHKS